MAGKPLKTLADQLRNNYGITLLPTFDTGVVPGSMLSRQSWNDINPIGHLGKALVEGELPAIDGPKACMLADFRRTHEVSVDAALSVLQPVAGAEAHFQQASDAITSFDSPVTYTMDLNELEDVVEGQPDPFWTKAAAQKLRDKKTRVVYQTVRGRISFVFRGGGGASINLAAGPLSNLAKFQMDAGWRWRNEATIESKDELVLAVNYAKYNWGKAAFEPRGD